MNQTDNYLYSKKYPQLGEGSSEWIQLEYDLQLGLGSISAVIKEIKAINNQSLQFQFEKHNQNKLILESWIDQNKLGEASIDDICYKGFEFKDPQRGYVFPTGYIDLVEPTDNKQKQYTIIMFKIAVGRSQCVPCRGDEYKGQYSRDTSQFDSIYLYDDENDKSGNTFLHRYVLFEKDQVLPMYLIRFELDEKKESQLSPQICASCQINQAKVYCQNDDDYFCNDCSLDIHNQNQQKYSNKHVLIDISKKEKNFGQCSTHTETKLELYCMNCHLPLCVYCRIQGTHSQGEPSSHQLVKISEAYKKAIHESKVLDPQLEKRKNELSDNLNQIDQKIKDVSAKASQIEDKIYKLLQDGLDQLQEKTKEKMCVLIGDQLELKRQYDQIQWMEQFLKYQQNVLNPADYLKAWSRHSALRNKIISAENKVQINEISPEFIFDAQPIKITSDNIVQTNQNKQSNQDNIDQVNNATRTGTTPFRSQILSVKNSSARVNDKNSSMVNYIATSAKSQIKNNSSQFLATTGIQYNGGQGNIFQNSQRQGEE